MRQAYRERRCTYVVPVPQTSRPLSRRYGKKQKKNTLKPCSIGSRARLCHRRCDASYSDRQHADQKHNKKQKAHYRCQPRNTFYYSYVQLPSWSRFHREAPLCRLRNPAMSMPHIAETRIFYSHAGSARNCAKYLVRQAAIVQ